MVGCGGGEPPKSPPAPPPTPATRPAATVPTTTSTLERRSQAPSGPRPVPLVEMEQGGDLVAFGGLRWKDAEQQQLAAEVRLLKQPIGSIHYSIFAGDRLLASSYIPGSLFKAAGDTQTVYLPPATQIRAGKAYVADLLGATRLVVHVEPLEQEAVPAGQPAWVAGQVTACEGGSHADCLALATAFRTGKSDAGTVKPDPQLAEAFGKRFVDAAELSCATGAPDACLTLGTAYVSGTDAPAEPKRGIGLIQKACAAGHAPACDWMAANPNALVQTRH